MDFQKIIKEARPNIKDSSIKMYTQNLKKILGDSKDHKPLLKFDEIEKKLEGKSDNTKRNYYNAIIVLLQASKTPPKILRKYETVRDELNEKYDKNSTAGLSDKQKENFIELELIENMLVKMKKEILLKKLNKKDLKDFTKDDKELYDAYFLFSSYIQLPLRNDLAMTKIITKHQYNDLDEKEKEQNNYLVLAKKNFFLSLNNYKTSKKYNEKIIEIPKSLMSIYRPYINKQREFGYILTKKNGDPITKNYLTQFFQKISKKYLKKNISSVMMRKIVLSNKFASVNKEKSDMAHITGHSVATMDKHYIKQEEPITEEVKDDS
tara:strand:+ start:98 stop:1063 length:966 start_codon:yes stop_codon:yes gene_type:complete